MASSVLHCPSCASNLHYSIEKQAFQCESCTSSFTLEALEASDIDSAELWESFQREQAATPDPKVRYAVGTVEGERRRLYSCPSCGAQIQMDPDSATAECAFCRSHVTVADRLAAFSDGAPRRILPFTITREQASDAFSKLIRRKPFLPKAFVELVRKQRFQSVYVPFFLYDASLFGSITARCENISSWSDNDYNYTKTDTYEARCAGGMQIAALPLDASEKMNDTLMRALTPFDNADLEPYATAYLSGHSALIPDATLDSLTQNFHSLANSALKDALERTITEYDRVSVTAAQCSATDMSSEYVLYPVWVLSGFYKGQEYIFAMNGRTGKHSGALPMSTARVLKWGGLLWGVGTALSFLGLEVLTWLS